MKRQTKVSAFNLAESSKTSITVLQKDLIVPQWWQEMDIEILTIREYCNKKLSPSMQPYQKVALHFQTYVYPSYYQKLSFFQLLRPNSAYLASQRQIHSPCYPLCSTAEALIKGVLAYKRGTDRNTKTTKYRLFLGFSTTIQPNLPRNLLVGLVRRKGIRIVKTRKPPYKMPKPSRQKKKPPLEISDHQSNIFTFSFPSSSSQKIKTKLKTYKKDNKTNDYYGQYTQHTFPSPFSKIIPIKGSKKPKLGL